MDGDATNDGKAIASDGKSSKETVTAADDRARDVVQQAVEAAKNAPPPDPGEALTDVWADGGAAWRT